MNEQEQKLINEYLKNNTVTKCPDVYECVIEHVFNITASPKHKQRKKREALIFLQIVYTMLNPLQGGYL